MKKILLTLVVITAMATTIYAQRTSDTFANKDNVIGVGFGLGGVYGFSSYDTQSPVFGVQYDRGIVELKMGGVIGVGGFLGYKSYVDRYNFNNEKYKIRSNIVIIGARGTFHYDVFKVENLDTYGGAMIAFHIVNESSNLPNAVDPYYDYDHASAAYASIYAGAKYYFAPQVAAFAEVGYGVSWLTMGMAFKF